MSAILDRVLAAARQLGVSDIHLKVGLPPIFRIKGELRTVRDVPPLSRETLQTFALDMMNEHQRETFENTWDVDLAYAAPGGGRYRVNVFQQRGHIGLASLTCDRGFQPLRWRVARVRGAARVARLADRTDGDHTTVVLFHVEDPLVPTPFTLLQASTIRSAKSRPPATSLRSQRA